MWAQNEGNMSIIVLCCAKARNTVCKHWGPGQDWSRTQSSWLWNAPSRDSLSGRWRSQPPGLSPGTEWNPSQRGQWWPVYLSVIDFLEMLSPWPQQSEYPLFHLTFATKTNTRVESEATVYNSGGRCKWINTVFSHDLARETSGQFAFFVVDLKGILVYQMSPNILQEMV